MRKLIHGAPPRSTKRRHVLALVCILPAAASAQPPPTSALASLPMPVRQAVFAGDPAAIQAAIATLAAGQEARQLQLAAHVSAVGAAHARVDQKLAVAGIAVGAAACRQPVTPEARTTCANVLKHAQSVLQTSLSGAPAVTMGHACTDLITAGAAIGADALATVFKPCLDFNWELARSNVDAPARFMTAALNLVATGSPAIPHMAILTAHRAATLAANSALQRTAPNTAGHFALRAVVLASDPHTFADQPETALDAMRRAYLSARHSTSHAQVRRTLEVAAESPQLKLIYPGITSAIADILKGG